MTGSTSRTGGCGSLEVRDDFCVARTGQPAVAPADELMCAEEQEYRKGEDRRRAPQTWSNQERARRPPELGRAAPRAIPPKSADRPDRSGARLPRPPWSGEGRRGTGTLERSGRTGRTAGAGDPAAEGSAPLGGVGAVEAVTVSVPAAPVVAGPPPTRGPPGRRATARAGASGVDTSSVGGGDDGALEFDPRPCGRLCWNCPGGLADRRRKICRPSCRGQKCRGWSCRGWTCRGWTCQGWTCPGRSLGLELRTLELQESPRQGPRRTP